MFTNSKPTVLPRYQLSMVSKWANVLSQYVHGKLFSQSTDIFILIVHSVHTCMHSIPIILFSLLFPIRSKMSLQVRLPLRDLNEEEEVVFGTDIEGGDDEKKRNTSTVSASSFSDVSFGNPLMRWVKAYNQQIRLVFKGIKRTIFK